MTPDRLVLTTPLTPHACRLQCLPARPKVAGYSNGEMAAWCIAGIWSAHDALDLSARCAALMGAGSSHGQLAYVRGRDRIRDAKFVARYGCAIAIVNPEALPMVGGEEVDTAAFCQAAEAAGVVQSAPLDVHIASHTPLQAASTHLEDARRSAPLDPIGPDTALLNGGSATRVFAAQQGVGDLANDVARPIEWAVELDALIELRPERVLDMGPGRALAGMVRAAPNDARPRGERRPDVGEALSLVAIRLTPAPYPLSPQLPQKDSLQ